MTGCVYWITGLAGTGKTAVGQALVDLLRRERPDIVFLDGDTLRAVFGGRHGYEYQDRLHLASSYARLCKMLADQKLTVVCATVSMIEEVREWNRSNIGRYREIYLTAPEALLKERRSFYTDGSDPRLVVGQDPRYELPKTPDVIVHNDGSRSPEEIARSILLVAGEGRQ